MLVKLLVSNVITDFSYNLNKYIQYKYILKLFEAGYLHQHTVIDLYHLDSWIEMKSCSKFLRNLSNNRAFCRPEPNL